LLLEKKEPPERVVAITFTNRAAEEMLERLRVDLGEAAEGLSIGTFHAFCLHWLRQEQQGLTVVGGPLGDKILKGIFHGSSKAELNRLRHDIDAYYQVLATGGQEEISLKLNSKVTAYLTELESRNGIDINGVIPLLVSHLSAGTALNEKVCSSVRYLFIDEFQDLNGPQYELVKILSRKSSVFAIGDPDQAIYGFRGSNPRFFFKYIDDFKAQNVFLTRNYRSAAHVLEAAGEVISHNHADDYSYQLISQHKETGSIELYRASTPQAEAEFVVRRIEENMGGISHFSINTGRGGESQKSAGRSFKDFAILYRLNLQTPILTEALERRGIPYQVVNVPPFFMQKDIRPMYYWIRTAADEGDNWVETVEYLSLLKALPGIGDNTLMILEKKLPIGGFTDFFTQALGVDLQTAARESIYDVRRRLQEFRENVAGTGLREPVNQAMGYLRVNSNSAEAKRFLDLAGSFGGDLGAFSSYLLKNSSGTVYDDNAEAVSLMTLHAAKGLEFPIVFITGLEDGILPCQLPQGQNEDDSASFSTSLAEERRLFYVGMTRAQHSLILTSAAARSIYGDYKNRPISRFVQEIPEHLLQKAEADKTRKRKPTSKQMKLF
jgi:superfamily I DNA/RNA helicase